MLSRQHLLGSAVIPETPEGGHHTVHAASWWPACRSLPMLLHCCAGGPRSVCVACQLAGSMQVGSASALSHASLPPCMAPFSTAASPGCVAGALPW